VLKLALTSGAVLLAVGLIGAVGFLIVGCGLHRPIPYVQRAGETREPDASSSHTFLAGAEQSRYEGDLPRVRRVAGDLEASAEYSQGQYRSGVCRVPTPLPQGYPPPTPPGAIEVKEYPAVRRAGVGSKLPPDWGMNLAFWPLFHHIKRREIAMTAPVEVSYEGLSAPRASQPSDWTMYFLYRTRELGPEGLDPQDTRVLVEDVPPMTVIAIGMQGPYRLDAVKAGVAALRDWLASQSEWEEAGQVRALFYNGPEVRAASKWFEVQLPVRRRSGE